MRKCLNKVIKTIKVLSDSKVQKRFEALISIFSVKTMLPKLSKLGWCEIEILNEFIAFLSGLQETKL